MTYTDYLYYTYRLPTLHTTYMIIIDYLHITFIFLIWPIKITYITYTDYLQSL